MQQIITNILQSKSPLMVVLRMVLLGAVTIMGALRLRLMVLTIQHMTPYSKDIFQEYLIAKALVAGANPYLPLGELAEKFIGPISIFPHAAPYPPFVAVFSLPLLLFGAEQFDIAWFVFEILCVIAMSAMVAIWAGRGRTLAALTACFLFAWYPVQFDLLYGQMSILLAALLALTAGRSGLGGFLLGLSIALKLVTWPLLIYLVLKRQWRAAFAAAATVIVLNLTAALAMGFGPFFDFYLRVSPSVIPYYQAYGYNYSLWTVGWRLFAGTGSVVYDFHNAPPLLALPGLAPIVAAALPALLLGWGLRRAWKTESLETGYAIIVCICLLVSPITWLHYYVMLTLPMAVLLRSLARRGFPPWPTALTGLILLLMFLVNEHIRTFITGLSGGKAALLANGSQITFAVSLLTWLPILQVIGLVALLAWAGRKPPAAGECPGAAEA